MASPIKLKQAFSLLSLGIAPTSLTFDSTTLSSEKAICVRDNPPRKQPSLVILHTAQPTKPTRRPFTAEAALLHPQRDWIAIRAGPNVNVLQLATKKRIHSTVLPDAVTFWRWIADDVLAIITATAIFHWTLPEEPQPLFERHHSLANSQIIDYSTDASQQWFAVTALSAEPGGSIAGHVQLFSRTKNMSQILSAHAATFATLPLDTYSANLFLFASRTNNEETGKPESLLRIIELGASSYGKLSTEIYYPPEFSKDFPIALHVSSKYPTIVYLITKMGYIHLYDFV